MNSSAPASRGGLARPTRRRRPGRRAGCCPRPCRGTASDAGAPRRPAAATRRAGTDGRSTPPTRDSPAGRLEQAEQQRRRPCSCRRRSRRPAPPPRRARARARTRRAPAPGGPGTRTTPARAPTGARAGLGASRAPPAATAAGASSSANIRSATASPSALAWYSAPSRRNGRYSSGASTITASPASRPRLPSTSRTPAVDRDQRHAERRRQLEHRPGQEADAAASPSSRWR